MSLVNKILKEAAASKENGYTCDYQMWHKDVEDKDGWRVPAPKKLVLEKFKIVSAKLKSLGVKFLNAKQVSAPPELQPNSKTIYHHVEGKMVVPQKAVKYFFFFYENDPENPNASFDIEKDSSIHFFTKIYRTDSNNEVEDYDADEYGGVTTYHEKNQSDRVLTKPFPHVTFHGTNETTANTLLKRGIADGQYLALSSSMSEEFAIDKAVRWKDKYGIVLKIKPLPVEYLTWGEDVDEFILAKNVSPSYISIHKKIKITPKMIEDTVDKDNPDKHIFVKPKKL